jgi:hypothetical protein
VKKHKKSNEKRQQRKMSKNISQIMVANQASVQLKKSSKMIEELNKIKKSHNVQESSSKPSSSDSESIEDDVLEAASKYHRQSSNIVCCHTRKKGQHLFMLYPEDPFKNYWDLFIAVVLIFTCLVTPYRIALIELDNRKWVVTNNIVDSLFLIDIFIIFNSAFYDEDFNLIDCRKEIAKNYLTTWFPIDFFAIIPFDLILQGNNFNEIVRIARIGKMYKLVKLTRLLRIFKMIKEKSKFAKYMKQFLNIGIGMQRLLGFFFSFFILIHIVACLWIMTAQFSVNGEGTWMEGDIYLMKAGEKYLTSVYFTVTTITTVGYGDVNIRTKMEKSFQVLIMLIGVIAFSFASGSLASIL